jgi:hypothetical protein
MTIVHIEQWIETFGFDPSNCDPRELKRRIAIGIREMCNDLNQRSDRRDITVGLRRLEQAGRLLEEHRYLQEER